VIGARGRERTCQEASHLSREEYIPCGAPAVAVVDSGDAHPYFMCGPCAEHNVRNRGAIRWFTVEHQGLAPIGYRCVEGKLEAR
jgi:hypothetical protein